MGMNAVKRKLEPHVRRYLVLCGLLPPAHEENTIFRLPITSYIRLYASRSKAKSTADLVPGTKQVLTSEAARLEYGNL
ncbi:hypothetical protein EDB19DRAFT_1752028, partial [Suillus lakei]